MLRIVYVWPLIGAPRVLFPGPLAAGQTGAWARAMADSLLSRRLSGGDDSACTRPPPSPAPAPPPAAAGVGGENNSPRSPMRPLEFCFETSALFPFGEHRRRIRRRLGGSRASWILPGGGGWKSVGKPVTEEAIDALLRNAATGGGPPAGLECAIAGAARGGNSIRGTICCYHPRNHVPYLPYWDHYKAADHVPFLRVWDHCRAAGRPREVLGGGFRAGFRRAAATCGTALPLPD